MGMQHLSISLNLHWLCLPSECENLGILMHDCRWQWRTINYCDDLELKQPIYGKIHRIRRVRAAAKIWHLKHMLQEGCMVYQTTANDVFHKYKVRVRCDTGSACVFLNFL